MGRLTERSVLGNAFITLKKFEDEWEIANGEDDLIFHVRCDAIDKLAVYEDLAEQGSFLKVGDTVYQTDGTRVYETTVRRVIYDTDDMAFNEDAIGKSVFLTKQEVLKKMR